MVAGMGVFGKIKTFFNAVQHMATVEVYEKLHECTKEREQLTEEVNSLREELRIKQARTFHKNGYWLFWGEEHGGWEGPYCSVCYDSDDKLIRMHHYEGDEVEEDHYRCKVCRSWASSEPPSLDPSVEA